MRIVQFEVDGVTKRCEPEVGSLRYLPGLGWCVKVFDMDARSYMDVPLSTIAGWRADGGPRPGRAVITDRVAEWTPDQEEAEARQRVTSEDI